MDVVRFGFLRCVTKFMERLHLWRKAEKNDHWSKYNNAVDTMRKKYKKKKTLLKTSI